MSSYCGYSANSFFIYDDSLIHSLDQTAKFTMLKLALNCKDFLIKLNWYDKGKYINQYACTRIQAKTVQTSDNVMRLNCMI